MRNRIALSFVAPAVAGLALSFSAQAAPPAQALDGLSNANANVPSDIGSTVIDALQGGFTGQDLADIVRQQLNPDAASTLAGGSGFSDLALINVTNVPAPATALVFALAGLGHSRRRKN